jgi:threonine dehydrogenase-like Zn-dependent dehydrogenase
VVIGTGGLGHIGIQVLRALTPAELIVVDRSAQALKLAETLGATRTVNVTETDLADVVRELTQGVGADTSFEVTGVQAGLDLLERVTRMSGTVVIVGFHQGGDRSLPLGQWNWMAFDIVNAHFRDIDTIMHGMRTGMRLLTSGRLSLAGLVTHRFGLEDVNQAFAVAVEKPPGFVKATVSMA